MSLLNKAELLAFTGDYNAAAEALHQYKKTITQQDSSLLLTDVKLSRCYEHMGELEKCEEYWSKAMIQNERNLTDDTFMRGRAEFSLNQLRALIQQDTIEREAVMKKMEETERLFEKFSNTISYLQLLFIEAKQMLNIDVELCGACCKRAAKIVKTLEPTYKGGETDLEKTGNAAVQQYLRDYLKQMNAIHHFALASIPETGEEGEENGEEEGQGEEVDDDFEDADIKE
ncbi:Tetratricopeptide-like_helical domain superfamily [Hexamita inflata]|uniref:Tetratricopeptide-like helical domain superfamily n=1 Tax=Hexamita inflata TaxID=28002 RepID=A0AA86Q0S7_9EUKA|nr:Tetratricopeptide-like helical domain superfamily [Hexamita inflata]CAI9949636.1 Tetratricopeptide-like helical domain superfamily [Hexamita inflata]